jgi:hypothetical protein
MNWRLTKSIGRNKRSALRRDCLMANYRRAFARGAASSNGGFGERV